MSPARQPKPTTDAINDAIGALSDLLHSLRSHAKSAAKDVKATAGDVKRSAKKAGRSAVKSGKKVVRKVEAGGDGLLDRAAKVWHEITGSEDTGSRANGAPAGTRKRKAVRKARA